MGQKKKQIQDADHVIRRYVEGHMSGKTDEQTEVDGEFQSAEESTTGAVQTAHRQGERPARDPELTGGDIDAARDTADTAGEETVGGSNPTPDQDLMDDLGKGAGVTYEDNEPLKFGEKMTARDTNRWELDPASSEDYEDRQREQP